MTDLTNNLLTIGLPCADTADSKISVYDENMSPTQSSGPTQFYKFLELLGEGSFCKVYRAIFKPTNETIAVKVYTPYIFFIEF